MAEDLLQNQYTAALPVLNIPILVPVTDTASQDELGRQIRPGGDGNNHKLVCAVQASETGLGDDLESPVEGVGPAERSPPRGFTAPRTREGTFKRSNAAVSSPSGGQEAVWTNRRTGTHPHRGSVHRHPAQEMGFDVLVAVGEASADPGGEEPGEAREPVW